MTKFIQDSTASISEWNGYRTIRTEQNRTILSFKSTFRGQLHLFVTEILCHKKSKLGHKNCECLDIQYLTKYPTFRASESKSLILKHYKQPDAFR